MISVFINAVHLYGNKMTLIFNSGDVPVTVNDLLLAEIEGGSEVDEVLFLDNVRPYRKSSKTKPSCRSLFSRIIFCQQTKEECDV